MAEQELDARHLICPMPVLKARKALMPLATGDVLLLRATDPASRLIGQGVGYMAFAAAHPMLFRLMFSQERTEAAKVVREAHFAAISAAIPNAPAETRIRMSDFAWATVHGFIGLVLESQIGSAETARALKTRSVAILTAMAETVTRTGGAAE